MNEQTRIESLVAPAGRMDVVLDTDAYNEIDDQYAIAYLLRSNDRLHCEAIYAAPFSNEKTPNVADGMEQSYDELLKILRLCGREDMIPFSYKGSSRYLPDESTPVDSAAARDLVARANAHSRENPLYVVAIGAITNVASAILLDRGIVDKLVIVWLGGHALHCDHTKEFNMYQDIAAARVVFSCGTPLVQIPCMGVVSAFAVSAAELREWLIGVNPLCDYLAKNTIEYEDRYNAGKPWSKPIWDVVAVAWLLNDGQRFMLERCIPVHMPQYDHTYGAPMEDRFMKYVWHVNRTELLEDLFCKLRG